MTKSVYSLGARSPIKFYIPDRMAKYYNEAVDEFFKSQTRFNQRFGRPWDPDREPIEVRWTRHQKKAWNDFAKMFNQKAKLQGPFHVSDFMDDFLVKNVPSALVRGTMLWNRTITTFAMSGAVYGLLRGL